MLGITTALAFLKFLYVQRIKGFVPPSEPQLDPEALHEFKRLLGASRSYLEFGSGGSTILASQFDKPTLSVECDRFFAASVRKAVGDVKLIDVIDVSIGLTRDWGLPVFTKPTAVRLQRWKRYSEAPFRRIADRGVFPDFVLVDGRFRRACALQTAVHAAGKPVTIMLDDYFDGRDYYHSVEQFLGVPRRVGRAAIFEIDSKGLKQIPRAADLEGAAADFR